MIRVIAGRFKGKYLKRVPSELVRPMPQKLKEAYFSVVHHDLPECTFLDGFAGTGSMGIEALSQGARFAVFIDDYYPAVKTIRENLNRCSANDDARVLHQEFNRAVIRLSEERIQFDLIFLDPPYRLLDERNPLKVIYKRKILKEEGKIVLRHHFKTKFEAKYFQQGRMIEIGDDILSFFTVHSSTAMRTA